MRSLRKHQIAFISPGETGTHRCSYQDNPFGIAATSSMRTNSRGTTSEKQCPSDQVEEQEPPSGCICCATGKQEERPCCLRSRPGMSVRVKATGCCLPVDVRQAGAAA